MDNTVYTDEDSWKIVHSDDIWIFDKLILSKKLGYVCGPRGVDVPKPGMYITRPCVNFMGMGEGASFKNLIKVTDNLLEVGTFWCEIFKGKHLSIDYFKGNQKLCVEGIRNNIRDLSKWDIWKKTKDKRPFPSILKTLKGKYDWINVEFIGNKVIEVHLRRNPDFKDHTSEYIKPVIQGERIKPQKNEVFRKSSAFNRIGFYIKK